jgi:hypothetical protein
MKMKLNWKILIAIVVLVAASVWAVGSLLTRSYSGTGLNFGVGSGPITLTNPSDSALPAKLVSTRPGTFIVKSSIESVSGRSTTQQGSGRNNITQAFEFMLPSGVSEFTVTGSGDVNFVASTDTRLEATVQPLSAGDSRSTFLVAVIVILGSLFYLSHSNGHRWISASRRKKARDQAAAQETERQNFKRIYEHATSDKP